MAELQILMSSRKLVGRMLLIGVVVGRRGGRRWSTCGSVWGGGVEVGARVDLSMVVGCGSPCGMAGVRATCRLCAGLGRWGRGVVIRLC